MFEGQVGKNKMREGNSQQTRHDTFFKIQLNKKTKTRWIQPQPSKKERLQIVGVSCAKNLYKGQIEDGFRFSFNVRGMFSSLNVNLSWDRYVGRFYRYVD